MKFYYNPKLQRYEYSDLGVLVDHSPDFNDLLDRNFPVEPPLEFSGDDQLSDEEIAALFQQLGGVAND